MNTRNLLLRLSLPTLAVSCLLLALGGGSAWYVQWLQAENAENVANHIALVRATEEFEISVRETRSHLRQYLLDDDRRHFESVAWLQSESDSWVKEIEDLARTGQDKDRLQHIRQDYGEVMNELDALRRDVGLEPKTMRDRITRLAHAGLIDRVLTPTHALLKQYEERSKEAGAQVRDLNHTVSWVMLLLGVCGAISGILVGYCVATEIGKSLVNLSVPIHDAAGKLNQMVGPIRVKTGAALEDTQQSLEELAKQVGNVVDRLQRRERDVLRGEQLAALGQLAAGFAHELRNPLTSIKLLVQSSTDEHGIARLEPRDTLILDEEFTRLDKLIQTFLDFARPPQLQRAPADLLQLIDQTVHLALPRAEQQGTQLTWSHEGTFTRWSVDAGQIKQVLLNLILNGLDAIGTQGTLQVHAQQDSSGVTIRVADTGPGIPPDVKTRMFEPFFSTKEGGTGLGLAICRQIIENHGGTLTASNRSQAGAVFELHLPRRTTTESA